MKEISRYALKGSLATMLVLGLLQPFDIDKLEEGRLWFILGQSVCTYFCVCIAGYLSVKLFPKLYARQGSGVGVIAMRQAPVFVLATLLLTVVLLLFNGWFNTGSLLTYWQDEEGFTPIAFFRFLPSVGFVSVVIFSGMLFVERSNGLKNELEELRELNRLLEERHEKEMEIDPTAEVEEKKCLLESSTNNISLEVAPKDIIYIESMANYADVCYLEEGEPRHKTLRITMKQLRESLADAECLVPCHRAFIVNIRFIVSISTRPSGGYQLQIFGQDIQIPVARSYTEEIRKKIG